jgi:hypothetical protein
MCGRWALMPARVCTGAHRAALTNMSNVKRFVARARLEDGRMPVSFHILYRPAEWESCAR